MYPLRKRQTPFYWETQKGDRILVWSGDHYHRGNMLGLEAKTIWQKSLEGLWELKENFEADIETGYVKVTEYLEFLKNQGYSYDFVPLMISGILTDNAPGNPYQINFINLWNKKYGDKIQLEMISLNGFFKTVRDAGLDLPVYRGDMPDWWSDGVGSTPGQTKLFREAQRRLKVVKSLNENKGLISEDRIKNIEHDLMMYGEHTWGYSSSVWEPWNTMVNTLGYRNDFFATKAHIQVSDAMDDLLQEYGEESLVPGRAFYFKVVNPSDEPTKDITKLYTDFWEESALENGFEVICESTGESVPYQLENAARGMEVNILAALAPHEEKIYSLKPISEDKSDKFKYYPMWSEDKVKDCILMDGEFDESGITVDQNGITTPFVKIGWSREKGIYTWKDLKTGDEMLRRERKYGAFTPIYEVTPNENQLPITLHRNNMGRNRKGINVRRSEGVLNNVSILSKGSLFAKVELRYELPGTAYCSLLIIAYKDLPRVDVAIRMNKDSVLDPENIYLSMPFTAGEEDTLWVEKSGTVFRPRIDQIPGTGIDYYCIQEGVVFVGERKGVAISSPDIPLIHLGNIDHKPIALHEDGKGVGDGNQLYSWVMNNFWETNFKASLAGFYEFQYSVLWDNSFIDPNKAIKKCSITNSGLLSFRLKKS